MLKKLNTICPDCSNDCELFEFLEQNGGIELWIRCKECGMETFRVGENIFCRSEDRKTVDNHSIK